MIGTVSSYVPTSNILSKTDELFYKVAENLHNRRNTKATLKIFLFLTNFILTSTKQSKKLLTLIP